MGRWLLFSSLVIFKADGWFFPSLLKEKKFKVNFFAISCENMSMDFFTILRFTVNFIETLF